MKRALFAKLVPGGLQGALARNSNGAATPADINFLARMQAEAKGRDGYTGQAHSNNASNGNSNPKSDGYTFSTSYRPKDDGVFHCAEAAEITSKCPLNPATPDILIEASMWECFLNCCKEYDTEWIALLIGKLGKDSGGQPAYVIDKFYFPPQTASGAHVDVPTGVRPRAGTIGAIHSHVDMGVFWSGTDTAHSNWPVEIVINRKEQYEALSRFKLKCGEWAKGKAEVKLTGSYVSKAVDTQVKNAFRLGDSLDKANRAKLSATTSYIPAGVHKEDRAEVAEAIVSFKPSLPRLTYGTVPCAACSHYSHTEGSKCGVTDCKCETFVHPSNHPSNPFNACSTALCVRENGHNGYHKTASGDYFKYAPISSTKPDDEDGDKQVMSLEFPFMGVTDTIDSKDDPTDLSSEEYCQTCEGTGFVQGTSGYSLIAVPCPECKGHPGLSKLGAVRQAEDLLH